MTSDPHPTAPVRANTAAQSRFPFLGLAALITGAVMPAWAVVSAITGGLETAAWIPVVVLFLFPFNILFFALLAMAVLCGIFAVRIPGADRVLGWIGLILGGLQFIAAAAYLIWSGTDMLFGG